ncbi:aminotransferase class I/II-fold pyridoxal phosphate-dependent enzyme [Paraflavitalea soli]|nr:aminotransferase class I/II-fold pyridoxal phosphate-dependent enzyme [Paraflavitalea soli]
MMDFTSSLYLGMKHSSKELNDWQQLTTGVPAALGEADLALQVGNYVAGMQGLEEGLTAPSTLHLYWDLFDYLCHQPVVLFIDEKVYPVSRYGIEKLLIRKVPVHPFRHFDADHVAELIRKNSTRSTTPVIVSDGWCPSCGRAAPLQQYAALVKPLKGAVIVDDTQAFGVLGTRKRNGKPYGQGGGGLLRWQSLQSDTIITIVSLAKGLGVPMSVISSTHQFIGSFARHSQTRVNSSPVSLAHLQAAMNAFRINRLEGDERRSALWRNISLLRSLLQRAGILVQGGIFPVQAIRCHSRQQTIRLWEELKKRNIRSVLITPHGEQQPALCLIVHSDHTPGDIRVLADAIKKHHFLFKQSDHVNTLTGNPYRTGSAQTIPGWKAGA